ncbi:MAG: PKD domain-containing protein [Deltaproteobacteria bacterium]|nr:PKD domain-containing protein [Deltaproteobacteria bacterium]
MRRRLSLIAVLLLAACSGRNEHRPDLNNDPPEAQAGPDLSGNAGEELFFDGSASTDLDGEIVSYLWNFGDGSEASGVVVSHTYADGGNYLATLTVTDDRNAEDQDQALVTIAEPVPVAVASFPTPVHAGEPITFDATGSTAAAAISAWRWSFGDGTTATGETVTHTYDRSGTFTVRLTVEDIDARSGEWSGPIEVFPIDIDGVYDLAITPINANCGGYTASFTDTVLTLTVLDAEGNVTGQGNTGHTWTGTLSGTSLSLSSAYSAPTGGGCIDTTVDAVLSATFAGDGTFSGTAAPFYPGIIGCQCSAAFSVTGTPR